VYQPFRLAFQVPPLALAHLPSFVVGSRGAPLFAFCATDGAVRAIVEKNTTQSKNRFWQDNLQRLRRKYAA